MAIRNGVGAIVGGRRLAFKQVDSSGNQNLCQNSPATKVPSWRTGFGMTTSLKRTVCTGFAYALAVVRGGAGASFAAGSIFAVSRTQQCSISPGLLVLKSRLR